MQLGAVLTTPDRIRRHGYYGLIVGSGILVGGALQHSQKPTRRFLKHDALSSLPEREAYPNFEQAVRRTERH